MTMAKQTMQIKTDGDAAQHEQLEDGEKRSWVRISTDEQLKLEAAKSFGLPVYFAGKILLQSSRNAARILRVLSEERIRQAETMSYEDLKSVKLDEKAAKRQAKLETLLKICEAREKGVIRARNILKMDEKVNKVVCKIVR